jgi:hypothetical protein
MFDEGLYWYLVDVQEDAKAFLIQYPEIVFYVIGSLLCVASLIGTGDQSGTMTVGLGLMAIGYYLKNYA